MSMPLIRQGEGPLAAYLRIEQELVDRDRQIAEISLATDAPVPSTSTHPHRLPGDPWKLRGIPVVGVHGGVGGAIRGSKPGA